MESIAAHGFEIVLVQPSLSPSLYTLAGLHAPILCTSVSPVFPCVQVEPKRYGALDIPSDSLRCCEKKAGSKRRKDRRRVTAEENGTTS
jgi:hypothetical protein